MASPRTLHIRCATWDQVEAFYSRKLRRGRLLSMRVPFAPALGSELTIGLELPSHAVMTIDGMVRKCEPSDGDAKHWIEIELIGLGDELLRSLRDLVATQGASAAAAVGSSRSRSATGAPPASASANLSSPPPKAAPPAADPAVRAAIAAAAAAARSAFVDSGISIIRGTDQVTPLEEAAAALQISSAPTVQGRTSPLTQPPPMGGTARTPLAPPERPSGEDTVPRAVRITGSPASALAVAPAVVPAATAAVAPTVPVLEDELPGGERELFAELSGELRRLRQAAVHEVLGVSRDARAEEIRAGWMAHIRSFHPDVMARHRSDAVSHLAEELTILGNRAYDRLRVALVAEGRGAAFGPALFTPHGWLVGFEDLSTSDVPAARVLAAQRPSQPTLPPSIPSSSGPRASGGTGLGPSPFSSEGATGFEHLSSVAASRTGESFEAQARDLLASGDAGGAREVLATALVAYPRSRPLRSLYYVASALTALAAGQVVLATSQLETALAHHEGCVEASLLLDQIHRNGGTDYEAQRRLFQ
jgi:hypothetical protein